jgi:GTPase
MTLNFKKKINYMPHENGEGNVEYKFKLVKITTLKITKLTTQMLYRFMQGDGKAEYYLGVMDDGKIVGLTENELYTTLNSILDCLYELDAYYTKLSIYNQPDNKYCVHLKIEKKELPNSKIKL